MNRAPALLFDYTILSIKNYSAVKYKSTMKNLYVTDGGS
ncbi:Hypothetical protein EAG7_00259 [Klebsiella aerogenes]|nr:Hypothetical protein EAG7_00259 [Klebsiella aerogenes]CCG28879.1 hypothetical protein [Klebsiella aerogenes EA1509E]